MLHYEFMLSRINIFGGMVDRQSVSEFYPTDIMSWGQSAVTGMWWVVVEGSTVAAGIDENDIDNAVAYYANRRVQRMLAAA